MANRLNANSPKFYPSECIFLALSFFVVNWKTIFPEGIANIHVRQSIQNDTRAKLGGDFYRASLDAMLATCRP